MPKSKPHPTIEPNSECQSRFRENVRSLVERSGQPIFDAHAHLDREDTLNSAYYEHVSIDPWQLATTYGLMAKRDAVGYLHDGLAYQEEELYNRMKARLEVRRSLGIGRLDTCIDTTPDIGRRAFNVALRLREEFKSRGLYLGVGAYPLWGFKMPSEENDRVELFREVAQDADFLCGLPERDDAEDRLGFERHIKLILEQAIELNKPAHFHVDQANDPKEEGTERLIDVVRTIGSPKGEDSREPMVWAVHSISPSGYPEKRFWKMIEGLQEFNIGVICCPRAAISMRQIRCIEGPARNSIARVLEMLLVDVWVRLGSDNVSDVFVPTGKGDILNEAEVAADILRFYSPPVLCKLSIGQRLNEGDREIVRACLANHYDVLKTRAFIERQMKEGELPPWTIPY